MVLVRRSPFSDLKTVEDKDVMIRNFSELYDVWLNACGAVSRTAASRRRPQKTSVLVFCNLVGGIRHGLLTPYGDQTLFDDIVEFIIYGLQGPLKSVGQPFAPFYSPLIFCFSSQKFHKGIRRMSSRRPSPANVSTRHAQTTLDMARAVNTGARTGRETSLQYPRSAAGNKCLSLGYSAAMKAHHFRIEPCA